MKRENGKNKKNKKTANGLFQKNTTIILPCRDSNGNFQGGRVKVVGIPGGFVKI